MKGSRIAVIVVGAGLVFFALHGMHGWKTSGGCKICEFARGEI